MRAPIAFGLGEPFDAGENRIDIRRHPIGGEAHFGSGEIIEKRAIDREVGASGADQQGESDERDIRPYETAPNRGFRSNWTSVKRRRRLRQSLSPRSGPTLFRCQDKRECACRKAHARSRSRHSERGRAWFPIEAIWPPGYWTR